MHARTHAHTDGQPEDIVPPVHLSDAQRIQQRIQQNQLDQRVVDASNINAFKGWLNKTRETRMGFFMD